MDPNPSIKEKPLNIGKISKDANQERKMKISSL